MPKDKKVKYKKKAVAAVPKIKKKRRIVRPRKEK